MQTSLSLPSALDLSRPAHIKEPASVLQLARKKPRLERGSVVLKVCVKPCHDEDRRGTALFQLQSIVVAFMLATARSALRILRVGKPSFDVLEVPLKILVISKCT